MYCSNIQGEPEVRSCIKFNHNFPQRHWNQNNYNTRVPKYEMFVSWTRISHRYYKIIYTREKGRGGKGRYRYKLWTRAQFSPPYINHFEGDFNACSRYLEFPDFEPGSPRVGLVSSIPQYTCSPPPPADPAAPPSPSSTSSLA